MKIKPKHLLFLIFILTLIFRIYLAFNNQNFNDSEAYFNLRYIHHVIDNKAIMLYDTLSYSGRTVIQPPLFFIIMALLSFGSITLLKILPELFISFLIIIVYYMAKDVSENEYVALLSALFSGFIPIFLMETLNVLSIYSLALPILFFMLYSVLRLEDKFYLWGFIICSFLLPLLHPIAIVFILTIIFYFLLLSGGAITPTKLKKEALLFSVLIIALLELIIYKKAFFSYGINIIQQSIPANILIDSYKAISVPGLLIGLGIIPLVFGSIGVYIGIMKEKKKSVYLYGSFVLAILSLLVLRLITLSVGLMLIGIALTIFSSLTLVKLIQFINKTRVPKLNYLVVTLIIVFFVSLLFLPSYIGLKNLKGIDNEKVNDMLWLRENTREGDVILGNLEEGHLINEIAHRRNVIDENFLLAPNPIKRLKDTETIYTTFSKATILELLKKYDIKVIYFSEDTKQYYFVRHLKYATGDCFKAEGNFYVIGC